MPRRKHPYHKPGTLLFNGQTAWEAANSPIEIEDVLHPPSPSGQQRDIRTEVANVVAGFEELALIDVDRLVADLTHEVAYAQTMGLDRLTQGKTSKPHAWTLQILFRGVRTALERQGLIPTISEFYGADHEIKRSLYLRLAEEIAKIAGLQVAARRRDVAIAAARIEHGTTSE
jgi:hypothetical protein